ncbi:MAG: M18 family aminopeptidase [Oscillospiraceae bacterium]|nr:M18 family aminopeptidase [Oscillospiraceae bacterium]MCI9392070.1 M18 family aminopeptidase [Oscillospiraceae bacterium]
MRRRHDMQDLLTFLDRSPSRYHAVENLRLELEAAGYARLEEGRAWTLAPGGRYYVVRNGSALAAFRVPRRDGAGFMISASHSDSPTFRVKEHAELEGPDGYLRLNVEGYGGMLCAPWLDRPLTVAGRVLVSTDGGIEPRLVYVDRDLLLIPNVAIHMNREANTGYKYDPKCDMAPLMGLGAEKGTFRSLAAQAAGCAPEDILGTDLTLCLRQKGLVWGEKGEFLSAPRLDDLQCAWGCFRGFLEAGESAAVPVYALLDNEEVGSLTRQGADGTLLSDVVERVCAALGRDRAAAVANSFMVSADNAHAVHPNHPEYHDATHRPAMNAGLVIKHGVRYATDGAAQAVFTALCRRAGVPVQHFSNRSDLAGGSTLGNISNAHVSVNTVDIGLAQLAMHSCFETAGVRDAGYLVQAMTAFYAASYREEAGRMILD